MDPKAIALTAPEGVPVGLSDAMLRPVREGNAFESTVEQLATAIRLGVFSAGERLPPERELAEKLRVGRATLREAIGALRQAGFVTTTRGRAGGTMVVYVGPDPANPDDPAPSPDRIRDVLAYRRVVEPGAAELAARAELSSARRAWLCEALEAVDLERDERGHRVADARLHLAIASLADSPMLLDAVRQAQASLGDLLTAIPVIRRNIDHSNNQHAAIVDAILRGDAAAARAAMEEHCDATSALLRGLIG